MCLYTRDNKSKNEMSVFLKYFLQDPRQKLYVVSIYLLPLSTIPLFIYEFNDWIRNNKKHSSKVWYLLAKLFQKKVNDEGWSYDGRQRQTPNKYSSSNCFSLSWAQHFKVRWIMTDRYINLPINPYIKYKLPIAFTVAST